MKSNRIWNLLTNSSLLGLSSPRHIELFAIAYLESAQSLCRDLVELPENACFEKGSVVLFLSAHAVELFLKGAFLLKAQNESFGHDLDHIYDRYKALFPAKRFAFTNMPFVAAYIGMTKQQIAKISHKRVDPSEIYRHTQDKTGVQWQALLGFEVNSFQENLPHWPWTFAVSATSMTPNPSREPRLNGIATPFAPSLHLKPQPGRAI
jgi:hypothetical protein